VYQPIVRGIGCASVWNRYMDATARQRHARAGKVAGASIWGGISWIVGCVYSAYFLPVSALGLLAGRGAGARTQTLSWRNDGYDDSDRHSARHAHDARVLWVLQRNLAYSRYSLA
jgi:hypothetical protein